jgi:hypothetical protein
MFAAEKEPPDEYQVDHCPAPPEIASPRAGIVTAANITKPSARLFVPDISNLLFRTSRRSLSKAQCANQPERVLGGSTHPD